MGQFLCDNNLVDKEEYRKTNALYYQQYLAQTIDIHAYLQFSLKPLTQYPLETLYQWREQFIHERIYPLVSLHNQSLVQQHQRHDDIIVLITATQHFIVEPIADIFAISHLIATQAEMKGDRFSGNVVGTPCFHDGKLKRFKEWLGQERPQYETSWFYSDSINDLPLLEFVDQPVIKNGDNKLLEVARQRNWRIDVQKQV